MATRPACRIAPEQPVRSRGPARQSCPWPPLRKRTAVLPRRRPGPGTDQDGSLWLSRVRRSEGRDGRPPARPPGARSRFLDRSGRRRGTPVRAQPPTRPGFGTSQGGRRTGLHGRGSAVPVERTSGANVIAATRAMQAQDRVPRSASSWFYATEPACPTREETLGVRPIG